MGGGGVDLHAPESELVEGRHLPALEQVISDRRQPRGPERGDCSSYSELCKSACRPAVVPSERESGREEEEEEEAAAAASKSHDRLSASRRVAGGTIEPTPAR